MGFQLSTIVATTNFSSLDWLIVIVYLAGSVAIGIAVKKYARNMADYVAAGRGVNTALGVATLTGTELGLVTVMYSAQKGFASGFAAFHMAVIACVVTFVVGATGFFIYRLRQMEVLTIPEFYERRFGRKTRILGGIMLTFGGVLNMGLFLKVGSMFIVGITGMSETGWALPVVMTTLLCLVLVYTVLGGMVAVIITDYVQFVVLSVGMLAAMSYAIYHVGWNNLFETVAKFKGEGGFNPIDPSGGFGIEYIIWMCFTAGLVGCAIWPTAVARALAADSPKTVKKQFMLSSVSYLIRFMIPYVLGICAFVFIMKTAPDLKERFFPSAEGAIAENNLYATPIFLGRLLPIGLIGLVTAGMLAAFMSTHDSYLLCWSSVITQDIIAPIFGDRISTKTRILITRICILLIGGYILYWGLAYKGGEHIWDYMAISGGIYSIGAFALLLAGLYWKRASSTGAFASLLAACIIIIALDPVQKAITRILGLTNGGIGMTFTEFAESRGYAITNPRISAWIGISCIILSLGVMVILSLLFPDKPKLEQSQQKEILPGGAK